MSDRAPFLLLADVFGDESTARVFSWEGHVAAWLRVERALASAQAHEGIIPSAAAEAIDSTLERFQVAPDRVVGPTRNVGYPILPLLEQIRRSTDDPQVAAWLHWGATTQDIMDTGLVLQLDAALSRLEDLLALTGDRLALHADTHRLTVMAGRTHAQPAVPTTMGAKVAIWLGEWARHGHRLRAVRAESAVVSLFGAAGTSAATGPRSAHVRRRLAEDLGLASTDIPWHTARDRLAAVGFAVAALTATAAKVAREVIELSRPEIGELREGGDAHHRGASSTMPQKENPVLSEVIVAFGIEAAHSAPLLLSAMQAPHERSAGEWQVEWDAIPRLLGASAGALVNLQELVDRLVVDPERMRANLKIGYGTLMAEAVMFRLAQLDGLATAHDRMYEASRRARDEQRTLSEVLPEMLNEQQMEALSPIDELLDPLTYVGEASSIVDAALREWQRYRAVEGPVPTVVGR